MPSALVISWAGDRPLIATFVNTEKGVSKQFPLWKRGLGTKYETVIKNVKIIQQIVAKCNEIVIFDYKKYLDYFGLQDVGKVYDYPEFQSEDLAEITKFITENANLIVGTWQEVRAKAAVVYHNLEKTGVRVEHRIIHPHYEMDVFSGRSKTTGPFSIQGMQEEWNVKHVHSRYDILVNFDWISADLRMAALLSQDEELLKCFIDSDPYSYIEKCMDGSASRDECKREFVAAIYSLAGDSEILKIFPRFATWMTEQLVLMKEHGYTESVLGRRFLTDGTRKGERRAFNSIMQGSVAHALQCVISRVSEECGAIILTEQHDSLTIATSADLIKKNIVDIADIMLRPFSGLIPDSFTMPLRVSVGKAWQKWKYLKDYR